MKHREDDIFSPVKVWTNLLIFYFGLAKEIYRERILQKKHSKFLEINIIFEKTSISIMIAPHACTG